MRTGAFIVAIGATLVFFFAAMWIGSGQKQIESLNDLAMGLFLGFALIMGTITIAAIVLSKR